MKESKIEVDPLSGRVLRIRGVEIPANAVAIVTPFAPSLADRLFSEREIQAIDDAFAWGERTRSKG